MTTPLLFALGSNGSSQLALGHASDVSVPKPVLLPSPPPHIAKIAAGGNHTLLLTTAGALLCAGDRTSGACGPSPPSPTVDGFHLLNHPLPRHSLVAATWEASFTVSDEGVRVYAFGTGMKGELGLGPLIFRTAVPAVVEGFPPEGTRIVDLAASMGHVVAVLSDGTAVVDTPRRVEGVGFRVERAVCGREFTVLFGGREGGDFAVLGSDKWGVKSRAPGREEVRGWRDVGAGWSNVYVLRGDGRVVSWGRDDQGQLAPVDLPPAVKMAVGSEHALVLSEEGDVTAWGWGEHGNCGPMGGEGPGKGQRNIIASSKYVPEGAKITAIGAGCATSWVAIEMPTPST
ncbi:regulator of chromosome condensation 1/beta-lactamase-inhibitor protein II [Schizothecium vesticola]|uniref:Regulator of chromosome condensation 1/beta-lactamase-inhibitor protein II n=1 Tax=Schizothecium vesticola TaxID=314040 RepID=A0AA40BQC4_9PEZI|nr:regulator of chromosome condensation 1/beta-lactamase-inhibitor protein II [Schizothecium vesticola]